MSLLIALAGLMAGAQATGATLDKNIVLREFATCIARSPALLDAAAVAAVIRTPPASAGEHDATLAMGATLMGCPPTDTTYHLKAGELRPYLAAALYYRAAAPQRGA